MPKKFIKDKGMMQRESLRYDETEFADPDTLNALLKRLAAISPDAQPDDMPNDGLRREYAKLCRATLGNVGLANLMDGQGAVNFGPLRERGLDEDSAPWIAAHWLGAYNRLMLLRKNFRAGDTSEAGLGDMLLHAEDLGRLQERMWWRAGIDPATRKRRETLALSGRDQVRSGQTGNKMRTQKSFIEQHGDDALRQFEEIQVRNPMLSMTAIRLQLAKHFGVSDSTVKNALRKLQKGG